MADPKKPGEETLPGDEEQLEGDELEGGEEEEGEEEVDTDAGDEGGEPPEPEGEEEGGEPEPPARPLSRSERRVATAVERAKAAELKAARIEGELEATRREMDQRRAPQQPQGESEQQFLERIGILTPAEQILEIRRRDRGEFDQKLNAVHFQTQDAADRNAFALECQGSKVFASVKAEVEKTLGDMRRQNPGFIVPRQLIAETLIGRRAVQRLNGGAGARQKKQAAARIARETVSPSSPRGDARPTRERAGDEGRRRAKVENFKF